MLKITNLKSGYNGMEILRGIDLRVSSGEVVAVIGPNGAGKSTALKSVFGQADIYGGEIVFEGKNITKLKTFELIKLGISYVPQGRQVFRDMTVLENLELGGFAFVDKKSIKKNIADVLKKFPVLKEKENERASSLSGGQQQILAIARALIQNPRLLLLDEPSLGLSPRAMREIFEKITEIRNEGVAVMIVEQNARQAANIADRIYIFENGAVALEGGQKILGDERVRGIYFGEE